LFALFTCVGRINWSIRTQITLQCSTVFLSEEFSSTKSHSFEIFCCKTSSCTKLVPSQELHQHESRCQSLPCTSKKCLMHFTKILIWASHAMFIRCNIYSKMNFATKTQRSKYREGQWVSNNARHKFTYTYRGGLIRELNDS
jgi:hypothetical protein